VEHAAAVTSVALSEKLGVSAGSADGSARVWRVNQKGKGSSLAALSHPDGVTTVSVNWAGTLLATGCVDGSVYVWSLTSFSTLAVLEHASPDDLGPWAAVSSVRLAADLLISGNRGGQLKLWSLTDEGKHVATLMPFQSEDGDTPPAIQGLAASALDGVIAVAGNDQLVIYRPLQKK